jgi:hypothetical protein
VRGTRSGSSASKTALQRNEPLVAPAARNDLGGRGDERGLGPRDLDPDELRGAEEARHVLTRAEQGDAARAAVEGAHVEDEAPTLRSMGHERNRRALARHERTVEPDRRSRDRHRAGPTASPARGASVEMSAPTSAALGRVLDAPRLRRDVSA